MDLGTVLPVVRLTANAQSAVLNASVLTPTGALIASSQTGGWDPDNVLVKDGQWWMSGTDTGNPEWVEFDFGTPVLIASVYAACGNGRSGSANKLQASDNGSTWVDIHTFDASKRVYSATDGLQHYRNTVEVGQAYRYIRLYSGPSPYCLYDFVQFTGVQ